MRVSLDGYWLWIAAGDELCRLEISALRAKSIGDWEVCKGRRFELKKSKVKEIREPSRSDSTEPIWGWRSAC